MDWPFQSIRPISWEAFATLVTGAIAVLAAWRVGLRQVDLIANQTAIQREQGERDLQLREEELKIALLERRWEVIEKIRPLVTTWWQDGRLSHEDTRRLLSLSQAAELLFSNEIANDLFHFASGMNQVLHAYRCAEEANRTDDDAKRQKWLELAFSREDEIRPMFETILQRMTEQSRIQMMGNRKSVHD
jgi:hypothetical protein